MNTNNKNVKVEAEYMDKTALMSGEEYRILLVEDNALNMKLFCDVLSVHGYQTFQLTRGEHIIIEIDQVKPHLILLDISLPDRSGHEVLKEIRAHPLYNNIPVIAMTAFAQADEKKDFIKNGFDDLLCKPIFVKNFLAMIENFVPKFAKYV